MTHKLSEGRVAEMRGGATANGGTRVCGPHHRHDRAWRCSIVVFLRRTPVVLIILVVLFAICVTAEVVSFPDPNLEITIREAIGKPTGDILQSDLVGLTYLDANERSISDLTGIEHCLDLAELYLASNHITNVTPLVGLTQLTRLDLYHNQITDLTPLGGLTQLTRLYLRGNQITDLTPLGGLTQLTQLTLRSNKITDLTPLAGLTALDYLTLGYNQIVDITALAARQPDRGHHPTGRVDQPHIA